MRCPGCGRIISKPDARFCSKCGYDLIKSGAQPGSSGNRPDPPTVSMDHADGWEPAGPARPGPVPPAAGKGSDNNGGSGRGSRILVIIIVLLLIMIIGMAGYLIYTILHGRPSGSRESGSDSTIEEPGEEEHGEGEGPGKEDPGEEDPGEEDPGEEKNGEEGESGGTGDTKITFEDLLETNQVSEQAGRLLPTAIGYKGHAYALFDNKEYGLTYQEIEAYCVKMGGHLAVINNAEENFVTYMLAVRNGQQTAFFGYSDEAVEYRWEWVYGDSDYERWNQKSNQPDNGGVSDAGNENYAQFMAGAGDGTWDDARLDANTTCYICEWEENAAIPDHVDPPEANKTDPSGESGTGKNPGPEPDPQENVPPQIFPDSSNTYLTDAQVNALSAEDVQKAINEIYARNGYRFKDPAWLAYYEQYDWYNGTIPSDQFDAAKEFNQIEFANVEKLRIRRDALKARGG